MSQITVIFYVTNIFIEITLLRVGITTIWYSRKFSIPFDISYANAMVNSSAHTTDSCRRILSLHVSFKKALGNHSVLSTHAADSAYHRPFYRSGKGAAINFARRQISTNSSCFTITRNNVSVGSQQHYLTAFFAGLVAYLCEQTRTINIIFFCHIHMAYRMSVSTEFSYVWSSGISNRSEFHSAHINIVF